MLKRKVNLKKTDHFLCLRCEEPTYGPYWDGANYFEGFYCETHGTWRWDSNLESWILGM